jgi:phosphonate dehydrogenase
MKPKVVITHWVHQEIIDFLQPHCELILNQTQDTLPYQTIVNRCKDADAMLGFMPDWVNNNFLAQCPDLKIVAGALKGYDNYDVKACEEHGVWFTIVPDLLTVPTAELTIGLLIAIGRQIVQSDAYIRERKFVGWKPRFYGSGLENSTVGILGMGAVGQATAKRLQGFDSNIIYFDIKRLNSDEENALNVQFKSFEHALSTSDFLVTILPLSQGNQHIINESTIDLMKPGCCIVNTGRGSTVDEKAICKALEQRRIAGYAADVFEFEDWAREDRPFSMYEGLVKASHNTVLTPHIGSAVDHVRRDIVMEAAINIVQALNGERPQGAINNPVQKSVA